jgi:hypothetical protein
VVIEENLQVGSQLEAACLGRMVFHQVGTKRMDFLLEVTDLGKVKVVVLGNLEGTLERHQVKGTVKALAEVNNKDL